MMMMEVENKNIAKEEEEEDVELPGFRFHPTDEELVGFYLRRKVEKRPIRLDLIKLVDIYKFDPWDLPRSNGVGEKEWYFFCRRGRKYKNSMRPNRVTRSGFWKATGIDRPIYSSSSSAARECIGLKKSLVYYRGSAGKGTKTDWMMHEFRLPAAHDKSTKHVDSKPIAQEAEVWTLCRILKRSANYRKCVPDWREMAAAKRSGASTAASETCSVESSDRNVQSGSSYISFSAAPVMKQQQHQIMMGHLSPASVVSEVAAVAAASSYNIYGDVNEFLRNADWEDLRSVVDCANNPLLYTDQYY